MATLRLTRPVENVRNYRLARMGGLAECHAAARERRGMRLEVHAKPHYLMAHVWALGECTAKLMMEDGNALITGGG